MFLCLVQCDAQLPSPKTDKHKAQLFVMFIYCHPYYLFYFFEHGTFIFQAGRQCNLDATRAIRSAI